MGELGEAGQGGRHRPQLVVRQAEVSQPLAVEQRPRQVPDVVTVQVQNLDITLQSTVHKTNIIEQIRK